MLDERSVAQDPSSDAVRPRVPRSTSPTASWRFAARLARREVRRRPGRTLLVMMLVFVPVFAMTLGIVTARTSSQSLDGKWQQTYGNADAVVRLRDNFFVGDNGIDLVYEPLQLPAGSTTIDFGVVFTPVTGPNADGDSIVNSVEYTDYPVGDAITGGSVTLTAGRLPSGPDEVALTPEVAELFDVGVGDLWTLTEPDVDWDVVGIVEKASSLSASWILVDDVDESMIRDEALMTVSLVDFPDDLAISDISALVDRSRQIGFDGNILTDDIEARADWRNAQAGVEPLAVLAGWVAGVVGFVAVGIVIAAAFAASARRQLVTVGQLSANGAPAKLIRRTLALQGSWSGLLGAAVAVPAAVAVARLGLPLMEKYVANRRLAGLSVMPLDLIVIVATAVLAASIAAVIPAKSAARMPVLAALAGRRPVADPPRWMGPTGLALFGGGLALLAAAVGTGDGNVFAVAMAVIGGLAVLFGMVCCSPFVVHGIGTMADRLRGAMRLAARSLARTRGRSAAVVTAIATVMAVSTAGLSTAASVTEYWVDQQVDTSVVSLNWYRNLYDYDAEAQTPGLAGDEPPLRTDVPFDELVTPAGVPEDTEAALERILPAAEWIPVREIAASDQRGGSILIADAAVLDRLDLADDLVERLAETGAVSINPYVPDSLTILDEDGGQRVDVGPPLAQERWDRGEIKTVFGLWADVVMTEERADAEGLRVVTSSYLVDNPTDLTADQTAEIDALRDEFYGAESAFVAPGESPSTERFDPGIDGSWEVQTPYVQSPFPATPVLLGGLAVTMFLVLTVVAIGLSLAATESRDERSVLHASGASPRTLRRLAAAKAFLLTSAAAVIAVPTGYVVVWVVTRVSDAPSPVPWVGVGSLLVGVPVIATVATLAVSALGQRFRPTPPIIARD